MNPIRREQRVECLQAAQLVMATQVLMHLLLTYLQEEAIEFDRIKPLVIFWIT